ncbi:MAG TPA: hypothetical protein VNR18_13465 [Hyphomicrobiales bacterium]|nr:hypothetical protein [Hyphomicrobiales bacterium]
MSMTLAQYLKKFPSGERFVLATIDPDGTPIRLADAPYVSEPTDTPANALFAPVIDTLPRLARTVRGKWGGGATGSWGPLVLATSRVGEVDLATTALKGKRIVLQLAGPAGTVPLSGAETILTGYIRGRSGTLDGAFSLELKDRSLLLDSTAVLNRFDASAMGVNFPEANDGKPIPLALGLLRNVESPVIDTTDHTRLVSDPARGQINDVLHVYNNGRAVGFTKDLANNTYTPTVVPVDGEVVTADIEGVKDASGSFVSSHTDMMTWLLSEIGGLSGAEIDIGGLPSDAAGLLINTETTLTQVLDQLAQSVLAVWHFTRGDVFRCRLIQAPSAGGRTFGEQLQLGEVSWGDDEEVFYSIPYRYARNWTVLDKLGAVATVDDEIWFRSAGSESAVTDNTILTNYIDARTAPMIETLFANKAPAEAVATRGLALYGTLRRNAKLTPPFTSPALSLLDSIALTGAEHLNGDSLVVTLNEDFGAETPLVEMEVWR